jgi:hypothetical protein
MRGFTVGCERARREVRNGAIVGNWMGLGMAAKGVAEPVEAT